MNIRHICIAATICLTTTGCLDIVHYLEQRPNRQLYVQQRISTTFSDEIKKQNIDFDTETALKSYNLPAGLNPSFRTISTDTVKGFEVTLQLPLAACIKPEAEVKLPLVPWIDRAGQYVFMFSNGKPKLDNAILMSMLMSSRYRFVFGNGLIPKQALILVNNGSEIKKFTSDIYSLGPMWNIDIPIGLLIVGESTVIVSFSGSIQDAEVTAHYTALNTKRAAEEAEAEKKREEQRLQEQRSQQAPQRNETKGSQKK